MSVILSRLASQLMLAMKTLAIQSLGVTLKAEDHLKNHLYEKN